MIGPIYQGFFGNKGSICVELSRYSRIKTKWSPVWTPESELYPDMWGWLGNMKGYSIVQEAIHYLRL